MGSKLQALELATMTKITIPNQSENSDYIHIVGTKEGIDRARHEIQLISEEQVSTDHNVRENCLFNLKLFVCGYTSTDIMDFKILNLLKDSSKNKQICFVLDIG